MKTYTDIRTTPLKFHKFYWKIWMPVQIVLGGWNFGLLSANVQDIDVYTRVDLAHYLLSGVLFAMAMGGFFRWKRSALVSVFAQIAENIVYVAAMYLVAVTTGGDTNFTLSALIGTLIRCIPVGIYYYNRRKLFVKGGYTRQQMEEINRGVSNSFAGSFFNNTNNNGYNPYVNGTDSMSNGHNAYQPQQNTEEPAYPTDSEGLHRVCPYCGKDVAENSAYCIHCGEKLK